MASLHYHMTPQYPGAVPKNPPMKGLTHSKARNTKRFHWASIELEATCPHNTPVHTSHDATTPRKGEARWQAALRNTKERLPTCPHI